jgi:two-component system, chemotaxis family, protein-glutamate methylesterase/glutaminase
MSQRCIVIGASAGGLEVVEDVVSEFPADLPVPVFVVMHVSASQPSILPEILTNAGLLPAVHPKDGTRIKPATIYVAPPDHHLLVADGYVEVKRGPKENRFRPSIDALFRSAAFSYGAGTIGVVLSGALDDGTSGLWNIKRFGGIAIVQDPYEARFPSMPTSALEYVKADYQLRAKEIGSLLSKLAREELASTAQSEREDKDKIRSRLEKEIQIAAGMPGSQRSVLDLGDLSEFTCPECHGALTKITEGKLERFRCHTGHSFTANALLEGVTESVGEMMWQVTRGLQEAEMLLEHIAEHMRDLGDAHYETFLKKAQELKRDAKQFEGMAMNHEHLSMDNLSQQPTD